MGKRPPDDMDMETLRREMSIINRRMEEIITILGGNSAYGVRGMRLDMSELKNEVDGIKKQIEQIQRENIERKKGEGFLNIKLDTIPQKVAAVVAFLAVLISIFQGLKSLFTVPQ